MIINIVKLMVNLFIIVDLVKNCRIIFFFVVFIIFLIFIFDVCLIDWEVDRLMKLI